MLSWFWDEPEPWTLQTYLRHDGYQALRNALAMKPDDVIATVKESGLRGRGGAQASDQGTKWSFIPQEATGAGAKPGTSSSTPTSPEPGTCKDMPLMFTTPHFLVEGAIIAAYAIHPGTPSSTCAARWCRCCRTQNAVAEAYEAGYLGTDIPAPGSIWTSSCTPARRAYICGEETALLDSLEGRRAASRGFRPPFPAVRTPAHRRQQRRVLASVHPSLLNGVDWFKSMGSEKSPGFTLYSLSGQCQPARAVRGAGHHPARTAGVRRQHPDRATS